MSRDIFH